VFLNSEENLVLLSSEFAYTATMDIFIGDTYASFIKNLMWKKHGNRASTNKKAQTFHFVSAPFC